MTRPGFQIRHPSPCADQPGDGASTREPSGKSKASTISPLWRELGLCLMLSPR